MFLGIHDAVRDAKDPPAGHRDFQWLRGQDVFYQDGYRVQLAELVGIAALIASGRQSEDLEDDVRVAKNPYVLSFDGLLPAGSGLQEVTRRHFTGCGAVSAERRQVPLEVELAWFRSLAAEAELLPLGSPSWPLWRRIVTAVSDIPGHVEDDLRQQRVFRRWWTP